MKTSKYNSSDIWPNTGSLSSVADLRIVLLSANSKIKVWISFQYHHACCNIADIKVDLSLKRGSQKQKKRESTDGTISIEKENLQSVSLADITTVERATFTNFSPSALGRAMNNPLIFSKTQAEPQ